MSYLYGITDIKYKHKHVKEKIRPKTIKFRRTLFLARSPQFDHDNWPISFQVTPPSLVELCVVAVDKLPLPSIYEWSEKDIRLWISRFGFPQYMQTFRVNMIWGRKLLLLDAGALSAMNIKDFDHIKRITYGIRMLFHFELTKFSRRLSLPDEKPSELYLLWHTQTGFNNDKVRRSDLYRRMQLIQERSSNRDHWDLLELWLRREREHKSELIAIVSQHKIDACCQRAAAERSRGKERDCRTCMPPCDCCVEDAKPAVPAKYLSRRSSDAHRIAQISLLAPEKYCTVCIPPCECHWPPRFYLTGAALSCLKGRFPARFSPDYLIEDAPRLQSSILLCWTRLSL